MKVEELKIGQQFKLEGQRKWRKVIYLHPNLTSGKPENIGCTLIGYDNCRQMVLHPEAEVITPSSEAVRMEG